jgi:hypothetical protein
MNEPILEIITNGTNAAVASGQITQLEAERLNKENAYAAAIEVEREISDCMANAE